MKKTPLERRGARLKGALREAIQALIAYGERDTHLLTAVLNEKVERIPKSIEVGQFWVYRRASLPPVLHEVTLVEGDYAESTSTFEDGTVNKRVVLSGRGCKGVGLHHMLKGRDDMGYWVFLPPAGVRRSRRTP